MPSLSLSRPLSMPLSALELIFHPSRGLCNFASHFWHFICLRLGLERLHPGPIPVHILARSLARFSRAAARPVRTAYSTQLNPTQPKPNSTQLDSFCFSIAIFNWVPPRRLRVRSSRYIQAKLFELRFAILLLSRVLPLSED